MLLSAQTFFSPAGVHPLRRDGVYAKCPRSLESGRGTGAQGRGRNRGAVMQRVCREGFDNFTRNVQPSAPAAEKV